VTRSFCTRSCSCVMARSVVNSCISATASWRFFAPARTSSSTWRWSSRSSAMATISLGVTAAPRSSHWPPPTSSSSKPSANALLLSSSATGAQNLAKTRSPPVSIHRHLPPPPWPLFPSLLCALFPCAGPRPKLVVVIVHPRPPGAVVLVSTSCWDLAQSAPCISLSLLCHSLPRSNHGRMLL
jgi:hypothetical protein